MTVGRGGRWWAVSGLVSFHVLSVSDVQVGVLSFVYGRATGPYVPCRDVPGNVPMPTKCPPNALIVRLISYDGCPMWAMRGVSGTVSAATDPPTPPMTNVGIKT